MENNVSIMILFIVFTFFLNISCNNSSENYEKEKPESYESIPLTKDNFYDFIQQYEHIDYYENGNIKEYNYISPKSSDTLFRFYYDEDGNPKSMDSNKKKLYIASYEFGNGSTITYMVKPPKFYCRIRVYENIENDDDALIDTLSCMVEYNVYDFPRVEILFTVADSVNNRPIYEARGFEIKDFDSLKFEYSNFIFE